MPRPIEINGPATGINAKAVIKPAPTVRAMSAPDWWRKINWVPAAIKLTAARPLSTFLIKVADLLNSALLVEIAWELTYWFPRHAFEYIFQLWLMNLPSLSKPFTLWRLVPKRNAPSPCLDNSATLVAKTTVPKFIKDAWRLWSNTVFARNRRTACVPDAD